MRRKKTCALDVAHFRFARLLVLHHLERIRNESRIVETLHEIGDAAAFIDRQQRKQLLHGRREPSHAQFGIEEQRHHRPRTQHIALGFQFIYLSFN